MGRSPKKMKNLYVVVLCGGGGTRLWPRSRNQTPKQFINFISPETLYQESIDHVRDLVPADRIIIITNETYLDRIKAESPQIPHENIILEPEKKDTALAMGVAAAYAYHLNPQAVVVNVAADHWIQDGKLFEKTLLTAAHIANNGEQIITVGIKPTSPHTGYGYIKAGQKIETRHGLPIYKVDSFKEKPDKTTAKRFLKTGKYFWNANLYTWQAKLILDMFKDLAPDLYKNINNIQSVLGKPNYRKVLKAEYRRARSVPIDIAISEKCDNLLVIPGMFPWSDIGDWKAVYEKGDKGKLGNMVIQSHESKPGRNVLFYNSKNNLVNYNENLIALVGVKDLVVVDTDDALLICHRNQAQDVKKIVQKLKALKKKKYL